MSPAIVIFAAVSIISLLFLFTRRKNSPNPPLSPGPWALPIIGNLASLPSELHSYFGSLARIHGPIFRLQLG
ncbi:Flavonoid 3'-monooxygenase CYP75B137 [Linum grandiflorum]